VSVLREEVRPVATDEAIFVVEGAWAVIDDDEGADMELERIGFAGFSAIVDEEEVPIPAAATAAEKPITPDDEALVIDALLTGGN